MNGITIFRETVLGELRLPNAYTHEDFVALGIKIAILTTLKIFIIVLESMGKLGILLKDLSLLETSTRKLVPNLHNKKDYPQFSSTLEVLFYCESSSFSTIFITSPHLNLILILIKCFVACYLNTACNLNRLGCCLSQRNFGTDCVGLALLNL